VVLASLDQSKVPAEYRGLARLFRDEVKAVDVRLDRTLVTIAAPLNARLRRHPRLRHEQIAIAVKLYGRDVPAAFRLGEVEVHPDRDAFEITETRLTATWMNATAWRDDDATEQGIAVARFALAMRPRRGMAQVWTPVALISAHAIGRWFSRTGLRDHAALVRDLAVLALAADDGDDRVATPVGGCWLGAVETMRGAGKVTARARNVRTWVGD
jgi:hypothetical protein